jgi:hypothetical protein
MDRQSEALEKEVDWVVAHPARAPRPERVGQDLGDRRHKATLGAKVRTDDEHREP